MTISVCQPDAGTVLIRHGRRHRVVARLFKAPSRYAPNSSKLSAATAKPQQEASGGVSIQRAGKFRWVYAKPYEQLMIGDGQKLWLYDKDLGPSHGLNAWIR